MSDKIGEELASWSKRTLVHITGTPEMVKQILDQPNKTFQTMPIEQLEESVLALSNYSLFLANELNTSKSRGKYFSMKFNERLSKVMVAHTVEGRSREERMMVACQKDSELDNLRERMETYKMKAERIEGLPVSINMHVSILRDIYRRRVGERR